MAKPQPIGELNGKWAFLLKLTLVFAPILATMLVGFSVWVVSEIYRGKYERLTRTDEIRITRQFREDLDGLGRTLRIDIDKLERGQLAILLELQNLNAKKKR
jgi:hypothetical protein